MIALFRKHVFFATLMVLILCPGPSWAEPVGTFTKIEGNVDLLRSGGTAAVPVQAGDAVSMGDAVRTKRNSKAELQFRDDSVIQLAPETRIKIDQYSFRSGDTREKGIIGLFRGKMRAIVSKLRAGIVPASLTDSNFSVKTPTAIAGVKGTDLIVYYERGITGVVFLEGHGILFNPDKPGRVVPVKAGHAAFVAGAGQTPSNARPVSDSFVAPHVKDTTISGTNPRAENGEGSDSGGGRSDITVNVTAPNTTYEALTDDPGAGGILTTASGEGGNTQLVVNKLDVSGGVSAGLLPPPPPPPYTETHAEALGTPVTVNVKIP